MAKKVITSEKIRIAKARIHNGSSWIRQANASIAAKDFIAAAAELRIAIRKFKVAEKHLK